MMESSGRRKLFAAFVGIFVVVAAVLLRERAKDNTAPPESKHPDSSSVPVSPVSDQPKHIVPVPTGDKAPAPVVIESSVRGAVRVVDTDEPAPYEAVLAIGDTGGVEFQAISDTEGRYYLKGLEPGREYTITVINEDSGYVATEWPKVTLARNERLDGIDLVLELGGRIFGATRFQGSKQAISGARIVASHSSQSAIQQEVYSNPDGTYALRPMPAGEYRVSCYPPADVNISYLGRYANSSKKVILAQGEEHRTNFSFRKGVAISGLIMGPAGPIEGATVGAFQRNYRPSRATSDSKGAYTLTGINGGRSTCSISAVADGFAGTGKAIPIVMSDVKNVDLFLDYAGTMSGSVIDSNGKAETKGKVTVHAEILDNAEWQTDHGQHYEMPPPGAVDAEGRFVIERIPAGTYTFDFTRLIEASGSPCLNDPIVLRAGEHISNLELLVVAAEEDVIEGYVHDGQGNPIPGVRAWAGNEHIGMKNKTLTDESGHYALDGLDFSPIGLSFTYAGYARVFLKNVPVGTRDANVILKLVGGIQGKVLDRLTKELVMGTQATIRSLPSDSPSETEGFMVWEMRGSKGGEFRFENLPPGTASLGVEAAGYVFETMDITIRSGEITTGIVVYLTQWGGVEGYITAEKEALDSMVVVVSRVSSEHVKKVRPNTEGYYLCEELPEGDYDVSLSTTEEVREDNRSDTCRVKPGQITRLDFDV